MHANPHTPPSTYLTLLSVLSVRALILALALTVALPPTVHYCTVCLSLPSVKVLLGLGLGFG